MKLEEVIKDFKFHCKFERNLSNKWNDPKLVDTFLFS